MWMLIGLWPIVSCSTPHKHQTYPAGHRSPLCDCVQTCKYEFLTCSTSHYPALSCSIQQIFLKSYDHRAVRKCQTIPIPKALKELQLRKLQALKRTCWKDYVQLCLGRQKSLSVSNWILFGKVQTSLFIWFIGTRYPLGLPVREC